MASRLDYLERLTIAIDLYRNPDQITIGKARCTKGITAALAATQAGLIPQGAWNDVISSVGITGAVVFIGDMPDSDKEHTLLRPSDVILMQIEIEKGFEQYCELHAE